MSSLIDALDDIVPAEPDDDAKTETAQPDESIVETQLVQEISSLWSDHVRLSADRKLTSKELRQVRARLAERLHEMKALLSRPGRGGQWRGWLRERKIPRSTADRLVARHSETLGIEEKNVPTEANPVETPAESAEKLAKDVWRRYGKALATEEAVIRFIACIAERSGVPYEVSADGLLILSAASDAAVALPGPATAGDGLAAHPPDESAANTPETALENPEAIPVAADQAAAVAVSSSGDAAA